MSVLSDREALWGFMKQHLGLEVPRRAFCAHHDAPFEYLATAYFEPGVDLLVWGPRGGGKTRLAAAATLLDLLHKPGITVRILGGSLDQSLRVWEHLLPDVERLAEDRLVKSRSRARRVQLSCGGSAAVLTQSQRAVRGQRVQKMRCDEVELFDPAVWEAAGATTRSLVSEGLRVAGVVEAFSTFHSPDGLMSKLVERAETTGTPRVIRWCILDVLAKCPAERDCTTCELREECGGRAKTDAEGFVPVEDVVAIKRRVSRDTWESELLCKRPSGKGRVFPHFNADEHVAAFDPPAGVVPELGVDFGYAAPFVALWIYRHPATGVVHVLDELVREERTVAEHVAEIRSRAWPCPRVIACDPAGRSRNEQTGRSNVALLRAEGFSVVTRRSEIVEGIEQLRRLIRPATGESRLRVHPRCQGLIRALSSYRYPPGGGSEVPEKDGVHDHPIDALRYWVINAGGAAMRGAGRV